MPKYLIERRIPDAGNMDTATLRAISQKSNDVLAELRGNGKNVQWLQSYVTDDSIHCVYVASDPDVVLEHARCGGFPADSIMRVRTMIDPTTGE